MALIYVYKSRGITKDLTFLDGSGDTIVTVDADVIRAVIGREGLLGTDLADAELVVTSEAPTANGSSFTKNYPESGKNRLRLDDADLADIPAGVYTLFVELKDSDDNNDWKNVDRQVLCIEET